MACKHKRISLVLRPLNEVECIRINNCIDCKARWEERLKLPVIIGDKQGKLL